MENKIQILESEIVAIQKENTDLWDEVAYRKTPTFLEELVRGELGLIRPNEKMVRWIEPKQPDQLKLDAFDTPSIPDVENPWIDLKE